MALIASGLATVLLGFFENRKNKLSSNFLIVLGTAILVLGIYYIKL